MKYLVWLVIALAVIVWLQRAKKSIAANTEQPQGGAGENKRSQRGERFSFARQKNREPVETMVQCAHCGMYFPSSESVSDVSGAVFCSDQHLRLASSS